MTLANKITLARIVLVPVFIICLIQGVPTWPLVIFVASSITDILDGMAARSLNQKTKLGSFLDPIADKMLLGSTFLALAHLKMAPVWVFVVVFSRDLLILIGWNVIFILTQKHFIESRWLGKATTLVQMLTVIVLLTPFLSPLIQTSIWMMVALTAASTLDYVWVGTKKLNELS